MTGAGARPFAAGQADEVRRPIADMEPTLAHQWEAGQHRARLVPVVTLAEARKVALENRRALAMGHDPRRSIPTLAQSSERVLAVHSANWKDGGRTEKIWRAGMRDYVMPQLGRKRVDQVTTADVMSVLLPHWSAKRETMRRIKQRLSGSSAGALPRATALTIPPGPHSTRPCPGTGRRPSTTRRCHMASRGGGRSGVEERRLAWNQGGVRVPSAACV